MNKKNKEALIFDKKSCERLGRDKGAMFVLSRLEKKNFESWIVGGAVRDAGLGLKVHDIDICTSARPDQIEEVFFDYKSLDVGKRYGTIRVIVDDDIYEVTTFRSDGNYSDGRRPDRVIFGDSIIEDLKRRDFTMNAMAWHPDRGLLDPYGGIEDLAAGFLRAVGRAQERIEEDGLRMLRAVRFASRFNLNLCPDLMEAIKKDGESIKNLASERIFDELNRMLENDRASYALDLLIESGLFSLIFPDFSIKPGQGDIFLYLDQDLSVRWAGLFCLREGEKLSYAGEILKELHASNKLQKEVNLLLKSLYEDIPADLPSCRRYMRDHDSYHWQIFKFKKALFKWREKAEGQHLISDLDKKMKTWSDNMNRVQELKLPIKIGDLDISGYDLLIKGYKRGKLIGESLSLLLEAVIDDELENRRPDLLAYLDRKIEK